MIFDKKYISASIICSDFVDLKKDIKLMEKGGTDFIHIDIMDGNFVPRLGIFPEIITSIKKITHIPLDVHLMVNNPLKWIPKMVEYKPEYISVHAESTKHLHYAVKKIKENGIKVGVVLNPATPIHVLDYLIEDLDLVVIMGINPGIVGHKFISSMIGKLKRLTEYRKINNGHFLIEVDGGVSFETGPRMIRSGVDIFVCGSSTIFNQEKPLDVKIDEFVKVLKKTV